MIKNIFYENLWRIKNVLKYVQLKFCYFGFIVPSLSGRLFLCFSIISSTKEQLFSSFLMLTMSRMREKVAIHCHQEIKTSHKILINQTMAFFMMILSSLDFKIIFLSSYKVLASLTHIFFLRNMGSINNKNKEGINVQCHLRVTSIEFIDFCVHEKGRKIFCRIT